MNTNPLFSSARLQFDCAKEAERISAFMQEVVLRRFRKKGVVVAVSGGVDSSVVAALSVRALGKDRVLALLMPERDSSAETLAFSRLITDHLGIDWVQEDISPMLAAVGCYRLQEDAIRRVVPDYGPGCKSKIILPPILNGEKFRLFSVVVQYPDSRTTTKLLDLTAYQSLVAATNFKQRTRKMLEYYQADRLNYAVVGTPNRLEYDQGFFVKLGDGAADIKPIAHLYKTQVYQMAELLGLPEPIRSRPPTTDTYSMPQSQEEFYFSLPYDKMDLALYGKDHGYSAAEVGRWMHLPAEQIERVFRDIDSKRRMAQYLHASPVVLEEPDYDSPKSRLEQDAA